MIVKIIQGLYPYNPGDIIDMPEHLARGQNAPYVEILKDQKTPTTNFQQQEMETTVIMGDPDDKDRATKRIPEPKEYGQVIQLEDVPKPGKNQKVAATTTEVTTPDEVQNPGNTGTQQGKTPEELQAEAEAQAKADLKAARVEALAKFEMAPELIEDLNLGELTEDEFNEVVAKAEDEAAKKADEVAKANTQTPAKAGKSK